MTGFDIGIYIIIALTYNIFVHNLASITYEDLQYDEKDDNTIIMLVIFGILGIVIANCIKNNKKYSNLYIQNGLYYGGILLLLTAILSNWPSMGSEGRLIIFTILLALILWYSYKIDPKK